MAIAIVFARGCLPCVVPSRLPGRSSRRHAWRRRKSGPGKGRCRTSCGNGPPWSCSCLTNRWCPTARRPSGSSAIRVRCAVGDTVGPRAILPWTTSRDGAARRIFPPWTTPWSRRSPVNWWQKPRNRCAASPGLMPLLGVALCWAPRSVAARCGGVSLRMPSHHGGTRTGFFRVIPPSPTRPARSRPLCGPVARGTPGAQGPHPQRR